MSQRTLVLCYHNLVLEKLAPAELESLLAVPVLRFAAHLDYLIARYEPATLDAVEGSAAGVHPRLVVTFDDGYRSVLTLALPLLKERRIPAYVFVNPAFVGGWNPRDLLMGLALYGPARAVAELSAVLDVSRLPRARERLFPILRAAMWQALRRRGETVYADIRDAFDRYGDAALQERLRYSRLLSWDELRVLRSQGIRVGSHTHRHIELQDLPPAAVRSEITEAQRLLASQLDADDRVLAYPRGKFDATTQAEAMRAGYRWGLTVVPGYLAGVEPTLSAPRVVVSPNDSLPALVWKISPLRLWARSSRPGRMFRKHRARRFGYATPAPTGGGRPDTAQASSPILPEVRR